MVNFEETLSKTTQILFFSAEKCRHIYYLLLLLKVASDRCFYKPTSIFHHAFSMPKKERMADIQELMQVYFLMQW